MTQRKTLKKDLKRTYLREDYVNFRPTAETMRQLEELWNAWGETRTSTIVRSIGLAYLMWKNGWVVKENQNPTPGPEPAPTPAAEFKALKVREE